MSTLMMLEEIQKVNTRCKELAAKVEELQKGLDNRIVKLTEKIEVLDRNTINLASWYDYDEDTLSEFEARYDTNIFIGLHPYLREILGKTPGESVVVRYHSRSVEAILEMTDGRIDNYPGIRPIETVIRSIQLSSALRDSLRIKTLGADIVKYRLGDGTIDLSTWY